MVRIKKEKQPNFCLNRVFPSVQVEKKNSRDVFCQPIKKKDNWRAIQCRKAPSLNNLMQFTVSSDENFKVDKKTVFVSYDDF